MPDYNSLILTYKERLLLIMLRFKKKHPGNIYQAPWTSLANKGFIKQNYLPERDREGCQIPDNTFSLTDTYYRFLIYERKQRINRYLTPIVIAFVTTVVTNLLQELWLPELINWLRGLF